MAHPEPPVPDGGDTDGFERRARLDAAREIERLVAANAASNATMNRLVEKVRQDASHRERKIELLENESRQMRRLLKMVTVVTALLLILAAFNAYSLSQARANADKTTQAAADAASTNRLLLSCFDVDSQCAKLNAEAQRQLLDEIKLYELTALYCTRVKPREEDPKAEEFLACVKRLYPDGPQLPKR